MSGNTSNLRVVESQTLFDVKAAWSTLTEAQRESIGIAAIIQAIGEAGDYSGRGTAFAAAAVEGAGALSDACEAALGDLDELPRPDLAAIDVKACRGCGCTEDAGCAEGCHWVEPDLCSSCSTKVVLLRPPALPLFDLDDLRAGIRALEPIPKTARETSDETQ